MYYIYIFVFAAAKVLSDPPHLRPHVPRAHCSTTGPSCSCVHVYIYIYTTVALRNASRRLFSPDDLAPSFKEPAAIIGHASVLLCITRLSLVMSAGTPITKPSGIRDFLCGLLAYRRK